MLFGEALIDQLKAIYEFMGVVSQHGQRLKTVEDHLEIVDGNVQLISTAAKLDDNAIKALKLNVSKINKRVTKLELKLA